MGVSVAPATICSSTSPPYGKTAVLLDDHLDRTKLQVPSGCFAPEIGYPWVFAACGRSGFALYSIPQHTWRTVAAPSDYCDQGACFDEPHAVGRYWIEWERAVTSPACCEAVSYRYQNIGTGAITSDPTTASTVPDLNLPGLVRDVCAPLQVPPSFNDHADGRGTLAFDGSFAISFSALPPKPGFPQSAGQSSYLERCGSRLRLRVRSNLSAWNATAILTGFDQRQGNGFKKTVYITGLELPSLRPLRIRKPLALQKGGVLPSVEGAVLTTRHLYLLDRSGRVWMAPAPAA
jgi:hypothetical protein